MVNHPFLNDVDINIVALFQQGNKDDYSRLYNKYAPAVLGVLTRTLGDQRLAEDCMHQAFCEIWSQRLQYDPQKERLFTWIIKIAKACADGNPLTEKAFADEEIREEIDLIYATDIKAYLQGKQQLDGDDFAAGIDHTIRQALHLIYFESFSFADAAKKLNVPADVLRASMIRTIRQLKGSILA